MWNNKVLCSSVASFGINKSAILFFLNPQNHKQIQDLPSIACRIGQWQQHLKVSSCASPLALMPLQQSINHLILALWRGRSHRCRAQGLQHVGVLSGPDKAFIYQSPLSSIWMEAKGPWTISIIHLCV